VFKVRGFCGGLQPDSSNKDANRITVADRARFLMVHSPSPRF
jgi:hypothetical protein